MKKVEWSQGKTRITDEEAMQYKDFNKVVELSATTGNKPYGKWGLAAGSVVLVALIALLAWPDAEPAKPLHNASYQTHYEAALSGEEIVAEVILVTVEVDRTTTLVTASSTEFHIPANALLDANGKPVAGEVEFRYRDFLDQKEVFLSGIPMTYDTVGITTHFESAGMFELLAYQNDKPLFIAPDKPIDVVFQTKETGDYFNVYYLQPEEGKWDFRGKDRSGYSKEELAAVEEELAHSKTAMALDSIRQEQLVLNATANRSKPRKPEKADEDAYRFSIKVNFQEYPELEAFDNLKFEVRKGDTDFKPEYASEQWDKATVDQDADEFFKVCFTNKDHGRVCFLTKPVVPKENYKEAMTHYKKLVAEHHELRKNIEEKNRSLKREMAALTAELEREKIVALKQRSGVLAGEVRGAVTRNFQMSEFGVWNCDYARDLTNARVLAVKFVDAAGKSTSFQTVFLVDRDRNMVISYTGKIPNVRYDTEANNMLWAVSNDGLSVSFVSVDQLGGIPPDAEEHTFRVSNMTSSTFSKMSAEEILNL